MVYNSTYSGAVIDTAVGKAHDESHTVVSHSDTTATGAQLNTLTGGGETTLHSHARDTRNQIIMGSDDNYVTDAEKTVIGNTSGTNTGDQIPAYTSMAVADLSDTATPSVLTVAETTNKIISNYKSTGADHVFTMPAAHSSGNVIFIIGDEFQVNIDPNGTDFFYLNGTAMAAGENIVNSEDTLGDSIVGMCANINGTLRWMFNSSSENWVEATP